MELFRVMDLRVNRLCVGNCDALLTGRGKPFFKTAEGVGCKCVSLTERLELEAGSGGRINA